MLNGSIILLVGSFFIGMATGQNRLDEIGPFVVASVKGVLCLFLLDIGLAVVRGLRQVVCIIRPERLDDLLTAAFKVVDRHMGVVTVSDCDVLRAERF